MAILLYCNDMPTVIRRILFDQIISGQDFHVAMVLTHPRRPFATLHTHDFWEMMYVLEGSGSHWVAQGSQERPPRISTSLVSTPQPLSSSTLYAGDLIWVRPWDIHTICARRGRLHFINVAFSARSWQTFRTTAGLDADSEAWDHQDKIPKIAISIDRQADCKAAFERILHAFHTHASRLDLCRFWAEVLPLLLPEREVENETFSDLPSWLKHVCEAMISPDNLQVGVSRMVQLSAVSPAHLSRTLKQGCGQTPTQFVNKLRLKRAAVLLQTTSQEIGEIALDCGYDNLSYFYRCFKQEYGCSPLAHRLAARHQILGTHSPNPIS